MTPLAVEAVIVPLIIFCRVGACFLVLPGISGGRIPMQLRVFIALALSLALSPIVGEDVRKLANSQSADLLAVLVTETLAGVLLGFLVRIFFLALEFAAIGMANLAGYGGVFAHSVEDGDAASPFSSFITLPAVALFFITDQHLNVFRMLQNSYGALTVGEAMNGSPSLPIIVNTLGTAFKLTLQLSAALVVYSLTINMAFGLLNKMVPQIPSYFVSTPFVVMGGLLILFQIDRSMLEIFSSLVSQAIANLGRNG